MDPRDALIEMGYIVQRGLGRVAATHDLSITQVRLLGMLRGRRLTITEVAGVLCLDKSSVTGLVDRAEARGIVQRVRSVSDRRSVRVALTAEGKRLIGKALPQLADEIDAMLEGLSEEQRGQLAEVVGAFVSANRSTR